MADPQPQAPLAPADNECCGNGCEPCVWTLYQQALEAYRQAQQAANADDDSSGKSSHG
jgi:hypothetical protein